MMWMQKLFLSLFMLFLGNIPILAAGGSVPAALLWIGGIVAGIGFAAFQIFGGSRRHLSLRIKILAGGYLLLWTTVLVMSTELIFLLVSLFYFNLNSEMFWALILSFLLTLLLTGFSVFNGSLRVILASGQMKLIWKILILFTMWIPLWNILLVMKACRIVRREWIQEANQQDATRCRKQREVCHTKFPVVMVHGIFFRDWQYMNYWGRIPYELKKNGAEVFYGKQQSALPVAESAEEVKENILEALKQTGAAKVNIIAHSKGGLDTRYAISKLGMNQYVASLTTVNTPHQGCIWAEKLLGKLPERMIVFTAERYNKLFRTLGDKQPDFLNAVKDLTASQCKMLNQSMPDMPGVYYQSVTSVMKSGRSAAFPLNLLFAIVKKSEGSNDGLVAEHSAHWGNFLGVLTNTKRRGISHADMIDLMRENIPGFNVREYYVNLVSDLKKRGF